MIPKSILGVSVWVTVLLDKFLFYRPTYRLLEDLRHAGPGPVAGHADRRPATAPAPVRAGVRPAWSSTASEQTLWHADETRWLVFATWEGKVGYRWYLWVFHAADVVVFVLSPGRSHEVPEEHFGPVEEGILVVDRYAAYQAMAQVKDGTIVLAFCWAHVRRDFLTVARSWPDQEAWALGWVDRIGVLYACNDRRLEAPRASPLFAARDQEVRRRVAAMEQQREDELAQPALHPARRKVLESLRHHWAGLTVFVDHPEVPMDNNTAERSERGPVVGRKNYYGSGCGLERSAGGDAVLAVPDAGVVGAQPADLADGVPDGVRGGRWPGRPRSRRRCCRGICRRSNAGPGRWNRPRTTVRRGERGPRMAACVTGAEASGGEWETEGGPPGRGTSAPCR